MLRFLGMTLIILLTLKISVEARAVGVARSENFSIYISGDEQILAEEVLKQSEKFRREIAVEWFEEEIPVGVGPAIISVTLSNKHESAFTWPIDHPDRRFHTVYLTTTRMDAVGSVLRHELAHVVLATEFSFPNRWPAFLEEGVASHYDNAERIAQRIKTLKWFQKTGNWPSALRVILLSQVSTGNSAEYAIAASLVDFFLSLRDKQTLFQFGKSPLSSELDRSLQKFYGIQDRTDLESRWRDWVIRSLPFLGASVIPENWEYYRPIQYRY